MQFKDCFLFDEGPPVSPGGAGGPRMHRRVRAGSACFLLELMVSVQSCSDEKLAFNESHHGRVLGILPRRVSCLKLEIGFFFSSKP